MHTRQIAIVLSESSCDFPQVSVERMLVTRTGGTGRSVTPVVELLELKAKMQVKSNKFTSPDSPTFSLPSDEFGTKQVQMWDPRVTTQRCAGGRSDQCCLRRW